MISPRLQGDAILWVYNPNGSSKKYHRDFNRDREWQTLGDFGLEGVRMVAIDEDWRTLRFRKTAYMRKLTRTFGALSKVGKQRTGKEPKS